MLESLSNLAKLISKDESLFKFHIFWSIAPKTVKQQMCTWPLGGLSSLPRVEEGAHSLGPPQGLSKAVSYTKYVYVPHPKG
jgi:hypothetical protein